MPKSKQIWFFPPPIPLNDLFHQATPINYSNVGWCHNHISSNFIIGIDLWQFWQEVSRIINWAFSYHQLAYLFQNNLRLVRIGSKWLASNLEIGIFIVITWRSRFYLWSRESGGICFEEEPAAVIHPRCIYFYPSSINIRSNFSLWLRLLCRFGWWQWGRRICPALVPAAGCSNCFWLSRILTFWWGGHPLGVVTWINRRNLWLCRSP